MTTLDPGTKLSRYEIRSKLGAGGMGEVYRARDPQLNREVAIKVLPASFTTDVKRLKRFEQEARATSGLNHPNIITIYEVGEADGIHYIATEFVDGQTLRERLKPPLKVTEALEIGIQVAAALAATHQAGIIHRDIKAENIMLRRDGIVKVMDFGLAKLTERIAPELVDGEAPTRARIETSPGVVMGTAAYMSPEQARGLTLDERTDIWSLGVVLYEMVAGRLPFVGETTSDVISMILHKEPPSLRLLSDEASERLDEIVTKALAKNREERYQVAKDLLIDLRRLKQHLDFESEIERTSPPESGSATARPSGEATQSATQSSTASSAVATRASSAEYLVNEIKQHKKGFAIGAAAVVALAVIVIGAYLWTSRRSAPVLTDRDTIVLADFDNTTGDAVFDGALKQGLAIQLEQSPFLNIFPEERVRETLRLMARSPDEPVTKDVAREICQRQGLKAYLAGSISNLGSHFVITVEAVNAQTGDALARQQVEAASKEQVLSTLGQAATKLREKLGESLSSIQKFDVPIEQATTSSLEALKAYSHGEEHTKNGRFNEAVSSHKRAVTLDPSFALAYSVLARNYSLAGQRELAAEPAQKAFDLRDRVSEREKLQISEIYYDLITGESDKLIEVLELLRQIYPRDMAARNNLGWVYLYSGRYKEAIEMFNEALRLDPGGFFPSGGMGEALTRLNRFDEAREFFNQSLARNPDAYYNHASLYELGFVQGDSALMKQQLDWASGRPDEYRAFDWQAETAAFAGRWREASNLYRRAVDLARGRDRKREGARIAAEAALMTAIFNQCRQARADSSEALALSRRSESMVAAAQALALCGEVGQAQSLADELAERGPKNTLIKAVGLPRIQAAIELQRRNPDKAIELLQPASRYEGGRGGFWPAYLSGQAYLLKRAGTDAAAEFQKILDHRGWAPTSYLYPLAHLGLARAAVLQGDTAKARKAYQDFFALWKDADPDIPILVEAKKEYEKVK